VQLKKAGKIKTELKGEDRKEEVEKEMRTGNRIQDADTTGRLRRGLNAMAGPQDVNGMARKACFSRRQFHRLTLRVMGETPAAHQRRVRLDRAAWLLLTTHATILDTALDTGWESPEVFTRAFRARFGVTPSAFRKDRGKNLPPALRAGFAIAINAAT
jgi:transcriptional regulator GlxA family with amidase domain